MNSGVRHLSVLFLASILAGCSNGGPTVNRIVPLGGTDALQLEFGAIGNVLTRRTYTIYGGGAASEIQVSTSRSGFSPPTTLRIMDPAGTMISTLTMDTLPGEQAVVIPGSVAVVDVSWPGTAPAPTASVKIEIKQAGNLLLPPSTGSGDGLVMSLNSPVELFFSEDNPTVYFLSVETAGASTVDVVLDGPGRVFVSDPTTGRIIVDSMTGQPLADAPSPLAVIDSTTGGLATLTPAPAPGDRLLLTVTNLGAPLQTGHARLSVNQVSDTFPLSVWFNTNELHAFGGRNAEELTTLMGTIAQVASQHLYRTTAGHVRFSNSTPAIRFAITPPPPGTPLDVRVDSVDLDPGDTYWRSHSFGFQDVPLGIIVLDADWFLMPPKDGGRVLAHEFFHYRYALPDEYREMFDASPGLCPASVMSNSAVGELCWPGNHNPTSDLFLALRTTLPPTSTPTPNVSMWSIMAGRLGTTVPVVSPPQVLKNPTSVRLP
jgi:hypothetical protein